MHRRRWPSARIDARPAILHLDDNRAVAVARGPQLQQAATVLESVHGLDGVADQIDENLLQLAAVAHDQRQFGLKLGPRRNIVNLQLLAERVEDANSQLIHIDRLVGLVGLAEQGANIVETPGWRDGRRRSSGSEPIASLRGSAAHGREIAAPRRRSRRCRQRLAYLVPDRSRHLLPCSSACCCARAAIRRSSGELVGRWRSSLSSRVFSTAMAAWAAKLESSSTCLSEKGRTSWRYRLNAPITSPSSTAAPPAPCARRRFRPARRGADRAAPYRLLPP